MLKDVEIDRHQENIKKLKAERTFRIKKELERYNLIMKQFKEYRECAFGKIENSQLDSQLARTLHKKRDSIKDIILSKLNLLDRKGDGSSRLTEEQLIEHEMLITDTNYIFFDIGIQVDIKIEHKSVATGAILEITEIGIETDQILEYIEIEEDKEFIEPEEHINPPAIYITNEKQEEIAAFSNTVNNLDVIIENPEAKEIASLESKNNNKKEDAFHSLDMQNFKKIVRKNSVFRWRAQYDKDSQTEDKIFVEVAKIEEEELVE